MLLSLQRMQGIEETDAGSGTLTVLAGTPLQRVQEAAEAAGWMFPLDIGARGSCSIGGNAATNAGGNRVLRYGMMRDLVLGLEAVLPDGTIVSSLNRMQKNNAGFDLKQLFIGSEGTLGVITRLVLRLVPRPASQNTALCALTGYAAASRLLRLARTRLGPALSAFELMWPDFYGLALAHAARQGRGTAPLAADHGLYLLIESSGFEPERDADPFTALIEAAIEEGLVEDAALAQRCATPRPSGNCASPAATSCPRSARAWGSISASPRAGSAISSTLVASAWARGGRPCAPLPSATPAMAISISSYRWTTGHCPCTRSKKWSTAACRRWEVPLPPNMASGCTSGRSCTIPARRPRSR